MYGRHFFSLYHIKDKKILKSKKLPNNILPILVGYTEGKKKYFRKKYFKRNDNYAIFFLINIILASYN